MTPEQSGPITIIGAGLAGSLLATLLAQRGFDVEVFEKRGDPRRSGYEGGRSITRRGLMLGAMVGLGIIFVVLFLAAALLVGLRTAVIYLRSRNP